MRSSNFLSKGALYSTSSGLNSSGSRTDTNATKMLPSGLELKLSGVPGRPSANASDVPSKIKFHDTPMT